MKGSQAGKNGITSLVCQMVDVILGFATRKVLIDTVGVELLGVNGTFASLLNTLSLAELGFEMAVVTSLYKPIEQDDTVMIEEMVSILKRIYEVVCIFVIVAGTAIAYFLPNIITGIKVDFSIYLAYFLYLAGSAITYLLAYKKSFLSANHSNYVINIVNTLCKVIATIVQICLLIRYKSFPLFVGVSIVQNLTANVAISIYVDKHYTYRFNRRINKELFKRVIIYVRDIFFGKIAGYVYASTDNLIISAFVNTIWVGLLGSYTQILYQLKNVMNNMFIAMRSDVASKFSEADDKSESYQIIKDWTFVRYVATVIIFVPGFVLCDCFVAAWLGSDYVLQPAISLLLVIDIYISLVHGMLVECINIFQFFDYERNISIVGAIINIGVSLFLAKQIGVAGVLVGTVVSQTYFWIARSIVMFRYYFLNDTRKFVNYWATCLGYTFVFFSMCFGCRYVFGLVPMSDSYIKFIIGGIICYLIIIPLMIIVFCRTPEFRFVKVKTNDYMNRFMRRFRKLL